MQFVPFWRMLGVFMQNGTDCEILNLNNRRHCAIEFSARILLHLNILDNCFRRAEDGLQKPDRPVRQSKPSGRRIRF